MTIQNCIRKLSHFSSIQLMSDTNYHSVISSVINMVNSYSSFFQFWCKKSNFSPVVGSSRGLDPDPAGSK